MWIHRIPILCVALLFSACSSTPGGGGDVEGGGASGFGAGGDAGEVDSPQAGSAHGGSQHVTGGKAGAGGEAVTEVGSRLPGVCLPARSSSPIPARAAVVSGDSLANASGTSVIFVKDIFQDFTTHCGSCHVTAALGGFQVGSETLFAQGDLVQSAIDAIESTSMPQGPESKSFNQRDANDPIVLLDKELRHSLETKQVPDAQTFADFTSHCGTCHVKLALGGLQVKSAAELNGQVSRAVKAIERTANMPEGNEAQAYANRDPNDAIVRLHNNLRLWLDSGLPQDVIRVPKADVGTGVYALSPEVGTALTNIGNCIPEDKFPFGSYPPDQKKMDELDAQFAAAKPLPAGPGVSGPQSLGLPEKLSDTDLFSFDSAELARYGVVAFQPTYPLWSDGSAKLRYIRVPRGQSVHFDPATQEFQIPPNTRFYKTFLKQVIDNTGQTAYRKIETRLIVSRPNTGAGNDQVEALFGTYRWNLDETEATLVTDYLNDGTPFTDTLIYYPLNDQAWDSVLGHAPGPDWNVEIELDNLNARRHYAIPGGKRCVQCHQGSVRGDFVLGFSPMQIWRRPKGKGGVIEPAGVDVEVGADELTQLERLVALGVITGVSSSRDILPLEESQGDRSPRNDHELQAQGYMFGNCAHCHNPRGYASTSAPELESSLNFWPNVKLPEKPGAAQPTAPPGIFQFPLALTSPRIFRGTNAIPIPYITPSLRDMAGGWPKEGENIQGDIAAFEAPYRSLIYRNTLTPFTYVDDNTLYPHMPLNTAGYDCRASQMLGSWMVSVPARVKPSLNLNASDDHDTGDKNQDDALSKVPQPWEEVSQSDADYASALDAAQARLIQFQGGDRYKFCANSPDLVVSNSAPIPGTVYPPVDPLSDIIDPAGIPTDPLVGKNTADVSYPQDGVPDHAHWVNTDITQRQGPYAPRRADWKELLVDGQPPPPFVGGTQDDNKSRLDQLKETISLLTDNGGVRFDPALVNFVSTPRPFALWNQDANCNFDKVKRVKDYNDALWITHGIAGPGLPPNAPVFEKLPGGLIYDMICINCHGEKFDSRGRQADNVELLTGGKSKVADFVDGLFGPKGQPGANLSAVFSAVTPTSLSTNDLVARYMSFMALGGTTATIPGAVLKLIGVAPVAGTRRAAPLATTLSANMLNSARGACEALYPFSGKDFSSGSWVSQFGVDPAYPTALLQTNGDAEFWLQLCTLGNPAPVQGVAWTESSQRWEAPYARSDYPADAPVGNQFGQVEVGIRAGNLHPWCYIPPGGLQLEKFLAWKDGTGGAGAATVRGADGIDYPVPVCPASALSVKLIDDVYNSHGDLTHIDNFEPWTKRGAINAGFAVYYYLKQATSGKLAPWQMAHYDQCSTLSAQAP